MPDMPTARYFHALAIDYDGTLAHHDRANPDALAALAEFRKAGGSVVLVTGRIVSELRTVFPDLDEDVDVVVGENGAEIESQGRMRVPAPRLSDQFCDALAARGVGRSRRRPRRSCCGGRLSRWYWPRSAGSSSSTTR